MTISLLMVSMRGTSRIFFDNILALFLRFDGFTVEALEIFAAFLAKTSLPQLRLDGNLGNEIGGQLLSCLHGNPSVKNLILSNIGIEGYTGGAILSALLRNMPVLKMLMCGCIPLGLDGALALQPGIRVNQTVEILGFAKMQPWQ